MLCFVYRPRIRGKTSALWSGRYRFDDMKKPVTVPLRTADELVARKRLGDLIVRLQRQKEGLAAGEPMREAAGKPFADVVTDYAADLRAQSRRPQHVKDTSRRLLRLAKECGWRSIADANPASFTKWRASAVMSAKTRKEYQVSLNAFFRWLMWTDRYDRNPFAKVKMPETRGKAVRRRRAFTEVEIERLLAVADHRRLPYLFMLYTGTRYREAWGLLWGDVHFTGPNGPYILIRSEETKDREARAIPLHPALYLEVFAHAANRGRRDTDDSRVFRGVFPTQKRASGKGSLAIDLRAAGIAKTDETGRVIDFQSFRKTWQTLGVNAGVAQRSAQAILGHSTPYLTANAYTDVGGLELHREMAKMPWLEHFLFK
jgi:integrase